MRAGESFYVFGHEFLGPGYEILKYWVLRERGDGRYDYAGGGVGGSHRGEGFPYQKAALTPEVAFERGKKAHLSQMVLEELELNRKLAALAKRRAKLQNLKFENVKIRGKAETFESFKRAWDSDY